MILSTPLIDLTNASQLTFRFRSKTTVSSLKVGLMTDPVNPAIFRVPLPVSGGQKLSPVPVVNLFLFRHSNTRIVVTLPVNVSGCLLWHKK